MDYLDKVYSKNATSNLEAECALLGSILDVQEFIDDAIQQKLSLNDFSYGPNGIVYDAILYLHEKNVKIDPILLNEVIVRRGQSDLVKPEYIDFIFEFNKNSINLKDYIKIIKDKSAKRKAKTIARRTLELVEQDNSDPDTIIAIMNNQIVDMMNERSGSDVHHIGDNWMDLWHEYKKRNEDKNPITGLPTGLQQLDYMTSGLQKSDLILLGAEPSCGKTSLATQWAISASLQGKNVLFASLEMSHKQIQTKIICQIGAHDGMSIRRGEFDINKVYPTFTKLPQMSIYITDDTMLTAQSLASHARLIQKKYGLDLIIIDYLQLMYTEPYIEMENLRYTEISRRLKGIAREFDVPVVALCQLNRPVSGTNPPPNLHRLRGSGAMGQDADVVMFLWREDGTGDKETKNAPTRMVKLLIEKQRNGPLGEIDLLFDKGSTMFYEMESLVEI